MSAAVVSGVCEGGIAGIDGLEEALLSYLHRYKAVAYSLARTGLRPTDARAVIGPPDHWVELPERDYWAM
ncbi:hypothetical protein ACIRQQ_08650 [Streptomyces fuscichromogenes]|uniref:hypothetical protein n=1 Tax=Streptomyces fuscichromogenes TaxID=1324013 RepID=UPI003819BF95